MLVAGDGWQVAVEAETVLDDLQALERRLNRKQRDGEVDVVILAIADTPRNRRALEAAPAAFAEFSRDARATLRALRVGARPDRSALVFV
jgi:hypothetical protein